MAMSPSCHPGPIARPVELAGTRPAVRATHSRRTAEICTRFGLTTIPRPFRLPPVRLDLSPGRLVAVVGPSGSGKSTLLAALRTGRPDARDLHAGRPAKKSLIDLVAPRNTLADAARLLTRCGLGQPSLWLHGWNELSTGQRFRASLARNVADCPPGALLLVDDFGDGLHDRLARAVAFNLRRIVDDTNLALVVALSSRRWLGDLQPDHVVRLDDPQGVSSADRRVVRRRAPRWLARAVIAPGNKADYARFASMHYRDADELGFVDRIFQLLPAGGDEALGIIVYAHGPLELALRNRATGGRFAGRPHFLNRHVRMLRRLVIHPDVRGCGVGRWLVRKTLPRVGTDYVECLSAAGAFTPVFERAGMTHVGRCEVNGKRRTAWRRLEAWGIDPARSDFDRVVCRNRRVRGLVTGVVYDWYARTTGGGCARVARQTPETLARLFRGIVRNQPHYYLWRRNT